MRTFWNVLCILLLLHALAAAGGVAWLYADGRLDRERVSRVYDMLAMTIEEEQQQQREEHALADELLQDAEHRAWLAQVSAGPQTMMDRLDTLQHRDEMSSVIHERTQREIADFRRLFANAQGLLAAERAEIEAQRVALDEILERERTRREDEDFQQAVSLYEQLRPRQTKQMFGQLLDESRLDDVVEYLAAMQPRNAAAVVGEFKTPEEIRRVTQVVERLRQRGIEVGPDAPQRLGPNAEAR